jgi:hypothetical protein
LADPIHVRALSEPDANCIYEALTDVRAEIHPRGAEWIVEVHPGHNRGETTAALLSALQACLDANAIESVQVELDGRAYTMHGSLPAAPRR